MSLAHDDSDLSDLSTAMAAFEHLQNSFRNPEDEDLLKHLLAQSKEEPKTAFLQAMWSFAAAKGGELVQDWQANGIDKSNAFDRLFFLLRHSRDQYLLLALRSDNIMYADADLWSICDFAVEKGKESYELWRLELDAEAGRLVAERAARTGSRVVNGGFPELYGSGADGALRRRRHSSRHFTVKECLVRAQRARLSQRMEMIRRSAGQDAKF